MQHLLRACFRLTLVVTVRVQPQWALGDSGAQGVMAASSAQQDLDRSSGGWGALSCSFLSWVFYLSLGAHVINSSVLYRSL